VIGVTGHRPSIEGVCSTCRHMPCTCPLTRVEPCACGGTIEAPAQNWTAIAETLRLHYRGLRHTSWESASEASGPRSTTRPRDLSVGRPDSSAADPGSEAELFRGYGL
jgi:hypothetical protein